jgi:uncharacterized membrane protein HdeD (DUF308 family)
MSRAAPYDANPLRDRPVLAPARAMHLHWRWFVGMGVAFLLLGIAAFSDVFLATLVTVFYVGLLMLLGAVVHIVAAFRVHKWRSFLFWLLSGLLYGVAGALVFKEPLVAVSALTIVVAAAMVIAGCLRIATGIRERPHGGSGWIVASGVMTLLVGLVIALGWPLNAPWLLGLFLAIDLVFQGAAALALGLALRQRSKAMQVLMY